MKRFIYVYCILAGLLGPLDFCWFNMMNFHFFHGPSSRTVLASFLRSSGSSLAIVLDPPFGARPELVTHTINSITAEARKLGGGKAGGKPKLFWVFPYFMEKKLKVRYFDQIIILNAVV